MMSDIEQARHARERGEILRTLKEDYQSEMTAVGTLLRVLDAQGYPLSQDGLEFHLRYLEEQAYTQIFRAKDMPGFRRDRPGWMKPNTPMFAKLLPKGLQLLDGMIEADPLVSF